ncbi:ABC transporter permease [Clostridia bacterium]|nr:ABC transporter permease [Clostridia bacterium]
MLSGAVYDLRVALHGRFAGKRKPNRKFMSKKTKDMIFYTVLIAFPIAQFAYFYVAVNVNSVLLAFKSYDILSGAYGFAGFSNFINIFKEFSGSNLMAKTAVNSLVAYAVGLIAGVPLALLFSFYITKKFPGHGFFKVILFLPSIISAIVMVVLFKYFVDRLYPEFMLRVFHKTVPGLLTDSRSAFATVLFYSILVGFGTGVLVYSGAIARIPASLTEAAKLDGITSLREFWYITLPLIFPTISTFLIVGVAGIFTNQLNLFSFFSSSAEYEVYTFGYFLFAQTAYAGTANYPRLAAYGLLFTLVAAPLTFGVKKLLEKLGPEATEF